MALSIMCSHTATALGRIIPKKIVPETRGVCADVQLQCKRRSFLQRSRGRMCVRAHDPDKADVRT